MQSQLNPDAPVKEYTGVWIPAEVMESDILSPIEKILYGEIAGFRECYASNAWLAKRIGRSEITASRLINNLMKHGFVENLGFNGRFRTIRVTIPPKKLVKNKSSLIKNDESASSKMTPIIEKYRNNNTKVLLDKSPVEKSEYGNREVNELFTYWKERTGIAPSSNKMNRNACHTLIRQRGVDGAKKVVDAIAHAINSNDRFAPRVSSFAELYGAYGKLSKLDAWIIKNSPKTALKRYQTAQTADSGADYEPTDEERAKTLAKMKQAREKLFNN